MCSKKMETLWEAKPHTLAKIAILKGYLYAWFSIFGRQERARDILYVDGFAGPGRYTNSSEGSPIAALRAAREVLGGSESKWKAGPIRCAFIESKPSTCNRLKEHLTPFMDSDRPHVYVLQSSFEDGIARLQQMMPTSFMSAQPLFAFIDPFGATGVPFATVRDILGSPNSEVLINFDADGFGRIYAGRDNANGDAILSRAFGDDSWREPLSLAWSSRDRTLIAAEIYKERLRSLPGVRYVYSFEMLTSQRSVGEVGYFLIFASQHPRGLEKMKEAMRGMDKLGTSQFSNAWVGQTALMRFDKPEMYSPLLHRHFAGGRCAGTAGYQEIWDFALNATPFPNPKKMLATLEEQGRIFVTSNDPKRRKGWFNPEKIVSITFLGDDRDG